MFEFHGWAVIKSDAGDDAADDALVRDLHARIDGMAPSIRSSFHLPDPVNGFHSVTITGLRNHDRHEVRGLLTWLASRSRQSYGIVYIRSDVTAAEKDAFRLLRLEIGAVAEFKDPFFA